MLQVRVPSQEKVWDAAGTMKMSERLRFHRGGNEVRGEQAPDHQGPGTRVGANAALHLSSVLCPPRYTWIQLRL